MSEEKPGADEAAARTIQAGFRDYRVRKRLQQRCDDIVEATIVVKQTGEEAEMLEEPQLAASASTMEDKSATKIQAGIRGFLVRKRQQAERAAATKIQAGFRGFRTRKLLKQTGQ